MTLDTVYWLALGVGLGLLVLSLLFGDILDVLPLDFPGSDFSAGPVFFAATAAFGAGGLLGINQFGFGTGASVLTGIGAGLGVGALTGLLFVLLRRQEAPEGFDRSKLVGLPGRAAMDLGPGRTGRVSVHYEGMTRSLTATSSEDITSGEEVVVKSVIGNTITVGRPAKSTSAAEKDAAES